MAKHLSGFRLAVAAVAVLVLCLVVSYWWLAALVLPFGDGVKWKAVRAVELSGPGTARVLGYLAASCPDSTTREWCFSALGGMRDEAATEELHTLLASDCPDVSFLAAYHLAVRGDDSGLVQLRQHEGDADWYGNLARDGLYQLGVDSP